VKGGRKGMTEKSFLLQGSGGVGDGRLIGVNDSVAGPVMIGRRALLGIFAAGIVAAAPTGGNAFGILRGAGDIRRIRMYSGRTGEHLDAIYWIEGTYIPEVMKEINHFMRDVRTGTAREIDPLVIDIMAASHQLMDVSEPYTLLSGFRTKQMAKAAERCASGGVGRYARSNFVHMDSGPIRHWRG
jgi:uncharacterized protein YcbK (DUF882 family)